MKRMGVCEEDGGGGYVKRMGGYVKRMGGTC